MTEGSDIVIRSLLLKNQRNNKKIQGSLSDYKSMRSWILQSDLINSFILDMDIVRNKKFKGVVSNFADNIYSILLNNGKEVSITHAVCHRYVIFPGKMLDENGNLKIGQTIDLYQPLENGSYYPDHAVYTVKAVDKTKNTTSSISPEEIKSLPRLPVYSQELVRILLRQDLPAEKLEVYIHNLIIDREKATRDIYREIGLSPFPLESKTIEYKEGVVRGPGDTSHGLTLSKTVAAFANSEGGTIWCGIKEVNDRPETVVGVENKILSQDQCELDIRNALQRYTASEALLSLISCKFYQYDGHMILAINVQPSSTPIFINGSEVHVRTGNQCTQYKNDSLTKFIIERSARTA